MKRFFISFLILLLLPPLASAVEGTCSSSDPKTLMINLNQLVQKGDSKLLSSCFVESITDEEKALAAGNQLIFGLSLSKFVEKGSEKFGKNEFWSTLGKSGFIINMFTGFIEKMNELSKSGTIQIEGNKAIVSLEIKEGESTSTTKVNITKIGDVWLFGDPDRSMPKSQVVAMARALEGFDQVAMAELDKSQNAQLFEQKISPHVEEFLQVLTGKEATEDNPMVTYNFSSSDANMSVSVNGQNMDVIENNGSGGGSTSSPFKWGENKMLVKYGKCSTDINFSFDKCHSLEIHPNHYQFPAFFMQIKSKEDGVYEASFNIDKDPKGNSQPVVFSDRKENAYGAVLLSNKLAVVTFSIDDQNTGINLIGTSGSNLFDFTPGKHVFTINYQFNKELMEAEGATEQSSQIMAYVMLPGIKEVVTLPFTSTDQMHKQFTFEVK